MGRRAAGSGLLFCQRRLDLFCLTLRSSSGGAGFARRPLGLARKARGLAPYFPSVCFAPSLALLPLCQRTLASMGLLPVCAAMGPSVRWGSGT